MQVKNSFFPKNFDLLTPSDLYDMDHPFFQTNNYITYYLISYMLLYVHIWWICDYICDPLPLKFEQKRYRLSLIKVQIKKLPNDARVAPASFIISTL